MKTTYVTRGEMQTLAEDIGRVTGQLAAEVERQRRHLIDLESTIADMQTAALATALAAPAPRPKRARSPRRKARHVMLAAAE